MFNKRELQDFYQRKKTFKGGDSGCIQIPFPVVPVEPDGPEAGFPGPRDILGKMVSDMDRLGGMEPV